MEQILSIIIDLILLGIVIKVVIRRWKLLGRKEVLENKNALREIEDILNGIK